MVHERCQWCVSWLTDCWLVFVLAGSSEELSFLRISRRRFAPEKSLKVSMCVQCLCFQVLVLQPEYANHNKPITCVSRWNCAKHATLPFDRSRPHWFRRVLRQVQVQQGWAGRSSAATGANKLVTKGRTIALGFLSYFHALSFQAAMISWYCSTVLFGSQAQNKNRN